MVPLDKGSGLGSPETWTGDGVVGEETIGPKPEKEDRSPRYFGGPLSTTSVGSPYERGWRQVGRSAGTAGATMVFCKKRRNVKSDGETCGPKTTREVSTRTEKVDLFLTRGHWGKDEKGRRQRDRSHLLSLLTADPTIVPGQEGRTNDPYSSTRETTPVAGFDSTEG